MTWYLGELVSSSESCDMDQESVHFNSVRNQGEESHSCVLTGSTLYFSCRNYTKNRAGLGGDVGNWSGPKANGRKAWSDRGLGIP